MRPAPTRSSVPVLALAAAALLAACDSGGGDAPATIELYIDGALVSEAPHIDFPPAVAGKDQIAAQIDLKNLGPGALELDGSPLVRIDNDDRLAFSVTQPAAARLARGETASVSVLFHPYSPGHSDARVVITAKDRDPFTIELSGDGVTDAGVDPILAVAIDGAPAGASFDFGAVATKDQKTVTLQLSNKGGGVLVLPPSGAVTVDDSAFTVATPAKTELAAGDHVEVGLAFEPALCASYDASLTIRTDAPAGDPLVVSLRGRGGTNPQGYDDVTEELTQPDADVSLTNAVDGARRLAVGNLAFAFFAGRVGVYAWDGCSLSAPRTLSPTTTGLPVQYFGAQVSLDDRGELMLVTAREVSEAWLFHLAADNAPSKIATLATQKAGKGNGRGAALAGDGSVAFIGQSLADSGFNAHGAVLVYPRPSAGWSDFTEARYRLAPSDPTDVQLVGAWVETSSDGRVVVAGGFGPNSGDGLGPPLAHLWEASGSGADQTWGVFNGSGTPPGATETVRLIGPGAAGDAAAVAIARDGATVAMPYLDDGQVRVAVWARPGASWSGLADANAHTPTNTIALGAGSKTRLALGPDGAFIIAAAVDGARELLRPASGWDGNVALANTRRWNVPIYGGITISPDGLALAGLDQTGRVWLVWR